MLWYVYILECSNKRYYVWSTRNVENRVLEHNNWEVKATKYVRPVVSLYTQAFESESVARKVEYRLKRQKSRKVIQKIINKQLDLSGISSDG